MREFALQNFARRPAEIVPFVERGGVIILRYFERRFALLVPYPRSYHMDPERLRAILKQAADEIADSAAELSRQVGPRIACHVCGRFDGPDA